MNSKYVLVLMQPKKFPFPPWHLCKFYAFILDQLNTLMSQSFVLFVTLNAAILTDCSFILKADSIRMKSSLLDLKSSQMINELRVLHKNFTGISA